MRIAVFLAFLMATARALPLQPGEQLAYRVSWAVVPGAGEIRIAAAQDDSSRQLRVTTTTATRRLARMLMPFDARSESTFDLATGKLVRLEESNRTRDKVGGFVLSLDPAARTAWFAPTDGRPPQQLSVPGDDPHDLIMGLLQTRSWDIGPGGKREAVIVFGSDFYELTIHFARYEEVRTSMGTYRTAVLEPRMDRTPPKGMFKRGGSVRVWIAQDELRLPVRFEVEFKIGTGVATLESYTPPVAKAAVQASPAHAQDPRS